MNHLAYVLANDKEVLRYLKTRFPVYHLSNVFLRDIHYGIMGYFREHKMTVRYPEAEKIARAFIEKLEREKILRQLDHQTWMVQYTDFRTPQVKAVAPAAEAKVPVPMAVAQAPVSVAAPKVSVHAAVAQAPVSAAAPVVAANVHTPVVVANVHASVVAAKA
jgi:hypothetical protein